jgi:hypothetical protein
VSGPEDTEPGAAPAGGSLLDRARSAYKQRTAKPTNDVPVLADPDTGKPIMWLRLGIPNEAQTSIVRQMLLDQGAGRQATSAVDHARFVGACVQSLGELDTEDGEAPKVVAVKNAAGTVEPWVPFAAQVTEMPCASPEQAVIALFTVQDEDGGPPRLDTQRLAEVSDAHRMAVLSDTQTAREQATNPGG